MFNYVGRATVREVRYENALKEILAQLVGIAEEDLTTAEKHIKRIVEGVSADYDFPKYKEN